MAWENRNGRRYYYRKVRRGAKVTSEYLGAGLLGELRAEYVDEDRSTRAAASAERQQLLATDAEHRQQLDALGQLVRQAVASGLRAAGYHQHKGTWRRRRMTEPSKTVITQEEARPLVAIAARIDAGTAKKDELATYRAALERLPDTWRIFGDMALHTEQTLMRSAGLGTATREALAVGVRKLRADLGMDVAPALERMVIEQIALAWLRLNIIECLSAQALGSNGIGQREHYDRLLSSAQRRHLRAVETLARVRRLLGPVVQVNVAAAGGQQVNVAGFVQSR